MGWVDDLRKRKVTEVLSAFGVELMRTGTFPCPSCGVEFRGSSDRRGAAGMRGDRLGWHCHRCKTTGGSIELASFLILGRKPERGDWKEFGRQLSERGLINGDYEAQDRSGPKRIRPRIAVDDEQSILRPPADELRAVWTASRPVTQDSEVSDWMVSRGINPANIERENVARALPEGLQEFPWMSRVTAYRRRAVLPVWDATGRCVSLKFRAIKDVDGPKCVSPSGAYDKRTGGKSYTVRNSVLASRIGSQILGRKADVSPRWDGSVMICEGEPDFLTLVDKGSERDKESAIFGIWSGAWCKSIADRIPVGTKVIIRTDRDETGDRYAMQIAKTLRSRCQVMRG